MHIALVYRSFHLAGSLPRQTVELARHLSERHDVHVYSIADTTERSLAPRCTFTHVPVAAVGDGRRFSARELSSFARNAAALLAREQFDVVHSLAPSTWVSDVLHVPGVAREEARLQGIPGWRYVAAAARHPGELVRRLLERKALGYPGLRRIHAGAPSVVRALVARYGIEPEDVIVVPPAVNLEEFRPPPDKAAARLAVGIRDPDVLVLLFCGSDFGRKGLDRAIRALGVLSAPARLLILGSGYDEPYRRLARDCGVAERVHFLGGRDDAWRFYHAADLLVLPTRADLWGVTPIEAMACGVPPIVSDAAGSSVTIRDGETGVVLSEPVEAAALRDAIEDLARDRDRLTAMGVAGLDTAKEHTWHERMRVVEDDLVAVAEGRTGAGPILSARKAWSRRRQGPEI